jgi:hypothetical protein
MCILWRVDPLLSSDFLSYDRFWTAVNTDATLLVDLLLESGCFLNAACRYVITRTLGAMSSYTCGGGVEYLHRHPTSRRRR